MYIHILFMAIPMIHVLLFHWFKVYYNYYNNYKYYNLLIFLHITCPYTCTCMYSVHVHVCITYTWHVHVVEEVVSFRSKYRDTLSQYILF